MCIGSSVTDHAVCTVEGMLNHCTVRIFGKGSGSGSDGGRSMHVYSSQKQSASQKCTVKQWLVKP